MARIFLLLNNDENKVKIEALSASFELCYAVFSDNSNDVLTQIKNFSPDIVIIDDTIENCELYLRQIKSSAQTQNPQTILILNNLIHAPYINVADCVIEAPLKDDILYSIVGSQLKIKKSLDRLNETNKELSKSLYQLNVLYNTSSQFAGTLSTDKLYEVMFEAMERTLSFDISCVLLFNTSRKPVFNLNTIYTPSENLVNALKIRSVLNYRTFFDENATLKRNVYQEMDEVEVIQKIKQTRSNKLYSLSAINFDSLFAPIKVADEIFGVVELFRENPFSAEDVTCFQAISHQVALPLRSAKLYEEISTANKKLEKLERVKSEFISIVSHELRTPLASILNSFDIILSGQAGTISSDTQNFVTIAKRNIMRLSGIIKDLLDLSQIEKGKLKIEYKMADITQSLELLAHTFEQVAADKDIKISLDIKEKLPEIYADTGRIEQIFSNLVSNSLKFTPEGGKIKVSAQVVSENEIDSKKLIFPNIKPFGDYIKVTVSDTGIGIKKEDVAKIFDKFSQIESSLNRNKGGIGLGLSIAKQLIDSHLGAIWVDSVEFEGSDFNVILPLADPRKIFQMDLLKAMTKHDNVGIVKIEAKLEYNLINELKEKKIIALSKQSKEVEIENSDYVTYCYFVPEISQESFGAMFETLNNYCKKINANEYDILLSGAHCSQSPEGVVEIANSLYG